MFTASQRRFLFTVFGTLILCAGLAAVTGCSIFRPAVAPHVQVARLCANFTQHNAAITCVKAGYSVIRDTATVVDQRYRAGRLGADRAEWVRQRLEEAYAATEFAELAVTAGDYGTANSRMATVIALLTAAEGSLQ